MIDFDYASLETRLRRHVAVLAGTPRVPGTPEHMVAGEYIRGFLGALGFQVERQRVPGGDHFGLNLLTRPVPDRADLPLLVVGAHYDSVPGSPGADDNASAVAALLELAQWIKPRLPLKKARLQLAAYDLEEYGMMGSALHGQAIAESATPLAGMISLEMLAYIDRRTGSQRLPAHLVGRYPDVGDFIGIVGNDRSRALLERVTAALKKIPGLPVEFLAVPGNGEVLPETRLSDHSSFWDLGFPALMITDTSFYRNPHYHRPSDTPSTLDFTFLARVTAGVCLAVEALL